MAAPSLSVSYKDLETMCREHIQPGFINEVTKATPFVTFLMERIETDSYGQRINVNFRHKRPDGNLIDEFGPNTKQGTDYKRREKVSRAYVTPKWARGAIHINVQEQDMNEGKAQLIKMLEMSFEDLRDDMVQSLSTGAWDDGTYTADGPWLGMQYWVPDDPTTGTVANVDRSDTTYQYWARSIVDSTTTMSDFSPSKLNVMWGNCSAGGGDQSRFPDYAITTKAIFDYLWAQVHPSLRNSASNKIGKRMVEIGLQHINFNGIPITWDLDCPDDHFYFLRSKDWRLCLYPKRNFSFTELMQLPNDEAIGKKLWLAGQIVCDAPCRQGCFTALA